MRTGSKPTDAFQICSTQPKSGAPTTVRCSSYTPVKAARTAPVKEISIPEGKYGPAPKPEDCAKTEVPEKNHESPIKGSPHLSYKYVNRDLKQIFITVY
jgi:hypothetical protein